MKPWLYAALLTNSIFLANVSFAEETLPKIPKEEKAFVDAINKFNKAKIVAQLGQPAKADDVKIKGTDKVAASIWHYHNINTAEDGTLYPTTELDFVDDTVVQVVFLNNDGSEANDGKTYEVPQKELPLEEVPQGYTPMNPPPGM